jgi:hypothetical protein
MTISPEHSLRLIQRAAAAEVVIVIAYWLTGLLWLPARRSGADPFQPRDPYLAVLEWLLIASAIGFVLITAGAAARSTERGRACAVAALAFATVFAGLTISAHFVQLAAMPRSPAAIVAWPSIPAALDLLAWDLFFGLALICLGLAAPDRSIWPRRLLLVAGALCLLGFAGPATGHIRLHLFAAIGYAVVFPAACFGLWRNASRVLAELNSA